MYRLVTRHRGRERVHAAPSAATYRRALGLVAEIVRQQASADPPVRVLLQRRVARRNGHPASTVAPPATAASGSGSADTGEWITLDTWDESVVARILGQGAERAGAAEVGLAIAPEDAGQAPAAETTEDRPAESAAPDLATPPAGLLANAEPPPAPADAPAEEPAPMGAAVAVPAVAAPLPKHGAGHRRSRWSLVVSVLIVIAAWLALAAYLGNWPGCGWLPGWHRPPAHEEPKSLPFDGPLLRGTQG